MKIPRVALVVSVSCSLISACAFAQDYAPSSLQAQSFSVTTLSGKSPFATNGNYMLFTSPLGSNFVALGAVETEFKSGTYAYTKTGTNSGVAALVDSHSGIHVSLALLFNSPAGGQITLTNTGQAGFQTASFTATNYTTVTAAQLYQPSVSNGTFNTYVRGQADAVYALETSSNLYNWSSVNSMNLSNQTGYFADTNAMNLSPRFYRAIATSVDFAPNSISNQSLNFTIASGGAPLATNGLLQWITDPSDAGYQETIGPDLTNMQVGTYSYSKTAPGAALISSLDSQDVAHYCSMVFTSPSSGFYYTTSTTEPGFQAGSFMIVSGPGVFLGNYHFTPDTARVGTLDFAADGNPASLTVTDAAGNVWTLSLPADALLTPETITMTPAASVDSSKAVLSASAAVLLEPDGIEFSDGVTLTVTTPTALGSHASLMNANLDGSDVTFALTTNVANTYATTLFHFSSAALANPTSQQLGNLGTSLSTFVASLNAGKSQAEKLEANKEPLPPPPIAPWSCDPASQAKATQAADEFIASAFEGENAVIQQLLAASLGLMKLQDQSDASQAETIIAQLYQMDIIPKLTAWENSYGPDANTLPVVLPVVLQVIRQAQLFGGSPPPGLLTTLQVDLNISGTDYAKEVRNQDVYSELSVATFIARMLKTIGGDNSTILTMLNGALTFQLTMDVIASANGTYFTEDLEAKGAFQIADNGTTIQGGGKCNYLKGTETANSSLTVTIAPGQSFTETNTIMLNDCPSTGAPTATITFTQLGSPTETWDFPAPDGPTVAADMAGICYYVFPNNRTANGFSFTVPLQDGNKEAVNYTVSGTGTLPDGGAMEAADVDLMLQHTPK